MGTTYGKQMMYVLNKNEERMRDEVLHMAINSEINMKQTKYVQEGSADSYTLWYKEIISW